MAPVRALPPTVPTARRWPVPRGSLRLARPKFGTFRADGACYADSTHLLYELGGHVDVRGEGAGRAPGRVYIINLRRRADRRRWMEQSAA